MGIDVAMRYGKRGETTETKAPTYTLLGSAEIAVNTTSTSAASAGTITIGSDVVDKDSIIMVSVRDKAGKRNGYFYGSDAWFENFQKANGSTTTLTAGGRQGLFCNSSGNMASASSSYGVYGYSISNAGVVTIRRRYNSSYGTINGTFVCKVFKVAYPDGENPFT